MRIIDILRTKGDRVVTVGTDTSLAGVIGTMAGAMIGAVVVEDAGIVLGVASEQDVVVALSRHGAAALGRPIGSLIAHEVVLIGATDSICRASLLMTERRVRHLPVVDGTTIIGLISIGDVVKARLTEKQLENQVLQDIAKWPRAA